MSNTFYRNLLCFLHVLCVSCYTFGGGLDFAYGRPGWGVFYIFVASIWYAIGRATWSLHSDKIAAGDP